MSAKEDAPDSVKGYTCEYYYDSKQKTCFIFAYKKIKGKVKEYRAYYGADGKLYRYIGPSGKIKDYKKGKTNIVTKHAEIIAIEKACKKLKTWHLNDCILYTTVEPCLMCSGAIIQSRIQKVIFATSNEKYGQLKKIAQNNKIKIQNKIPKNNIIKIKKRRTKNGRIKLILSAVARRGKTEDFIFGRGSSSERSEPEKPAAGNKTGFQR